MNVHTGGKTGVMNLSALHLVQYEQGSPPVMDGPTVWQQFEIAFDTLYKRTGRAGAAPMGE